MSEGNLPVRVLRVIARLNLGGPAHHVSLLSRQLDPERYETLLVTGSLGPGEEEHTDIDGITIRYVDQLGSDIRPIQDLSALISLIRLMREFRPSIVHTHTAKAGMLGRTAALLAPRPRPVIVHTYHGHVLRGYFGRVKSGVFRTMERALARISDRLIAVSSATVDELVDLKVAPPAKFAVVPLGLDLEPFLRLDLKPERGIRDEIGVEPGNVLFTYTGRLASIKRPDVMLRALAFARNDGAPVQVAVVGDGVMRPDLERLATELGCSSAVHFLGYRRDLARIAAGSDAALLTSDNEGTPVSLIEAAAAGRPAVATNVGGVPDIVIEGAGLLVPAGDEAAIAAQMARLAGDSALRRCMGSRAREHVREHYSGSRLLGDIEALYSQLLDSSGPVE